MSKITPYKGGRNERIEARITHEAKIALLARVDREGFGSFADWLEAQAMPQLTQRAADGAVCDLDHDMLALEGHSTCQNCGAIPPRR